MEKQRDYMLNAIQYYLDSKNNTKQKHLSLGVSKPIGTNTYLRYTQCAFKLQETMQQEKEISPP